MITDDEKWHCLAVTNLLFLLRSANSKPNGDYYCINCLHSFRKKNKLKSHENVCKNRDYCYIEQGT